MPCCLSAPCVTDIRNRMQVDNTCLRSRAKPKPVDMAPQTTLPMQISRMRSKSFPRIPTTGMKIACRGSQIPPAHTTALPS